MKLLFHFLLHSDIDCDNKYIGSLIVLFINEQIVYILDLYSCFTLTEMVYE